MDNSKTGFVTFLDVLGWKGIYQKRKDATALLEKKIFLKLSKHQYH